MDVSEQRPEVREEYQKLNDLPPVEAYFFERAETVCQEDERQAVLQTEATPLSGICQLVIDLGCGRQATGTGFLASPRCVLTAGHCVREGDGGNFFQSVTVSPGCRGALRPFGSQTIRKLRAPDGWKHDGRYADDFGIIILETEFEPSVNGATARACPSLSLTILHRKCPRPCGGLPG